MRACGWQLRAPLVRTALCSLSLKPCPTIVLIHGSWLLKLVNLKLHFDLFVEEFLDLNLILGLCLDQARVLCLGLNQLMLEFIVCKLRESIGLHLGDLQLQLGDLRFVFCNRPV